MASISETWILFFWLNVLSDFPLLILNCIILCGLKKASSLTWCWNPGISHQFKVILDFYVLGKGSCVRSALLHAAVTSKLLWENCQWPLESVKGVGQVRYGLFAAYFLWIEPGSSAIDTLAIAHSDSISALYLDTLYSAVWLRRRSTE